MASTTAHLPTERSSKRNRVRISFLMGMAPHNRDHFLLRLFLRRPVFKKVQLRNVTGSSHYPPLTVSELRKIELIERPITS
jgi:hypothetical protein